MKTVILYSSKKGFTKKCAEYLHKEISDSDIFTLEEKNIDYNQYDKILLGAPIYFGGISKEVLAFITEHKDILLKKKLGMFYSGMNKDEFDKTVKQCLPSDIYYHSTVVRAGGAYYFEKLNFLQRLIVKKVAKVYKTTEDFEFEKLNDLL